MRKKLFINNNHNSFKKTVSIDGDKSISIRTLLLGSQAYGKTSIENILSSEDIVNAIKCLRKLGIKITLDKSKCYVYGQGINGFEYKKKIYAFKNFKIDKKLVRLAKKDYIFLHCLPRGNEVSEDVFLSKNSYVWQQALNRVHVQKSILLYCFGKLR